MVEQGERQVEPGRDLEERAGAGPQGPELPYMRPEVLERQLARRVPGYFVGPDGVVYTKPVRARDFDKRYRERF
jgi:hypothetical protein